MSHNDRIVQYAMAGMTNEEIADREGLDAGNMSATVRRHLKPLGLKRPSKQKRDPCTDPEPFGLSDDSIWMRQRIGNLLMKIQDEHGIQQTRLLTGITAKNQNYALARGKSCLKKRPLNYTIAQMERIAEASGLSFKDFMSYITQDYK